MEMAVRSMKMAETAMETDGDGSEGTSPSRQGFGTETSVPQNLSSTAAELRNCSRKNAHLFRVFHPEASNRQRGVVRRRPGWPHNRWARPGAGTRPPVMWQPLAPLRLSFGLRYSFGKNKTSGTCFVQFREYFLCSFSETQKQQKIGNWHYGILLIGWFRKSHKNAMKCNEIQGKWCKNKHGA
jgi:hypothetical protein